jgi:membrane protease YdiL (CAAX protease family)
LRDHHASKGSIMDSPPPEPLSQAEAAAPEQPRRKGWTEVSWAVILVAVAAVIVQRSWPVSDAAVERAETQDLRLRMVVLELQGRYIVGAHALLGRLGGDLPGEGRKLNQGSVDQRLHAVPLLGELAGPVDALKELDRFDQLRRRHNVALNQTQERLRAILGRLYGDFNRGQFAAPSVTDQERSFLVEELGWFGDLALHPSTSPDAEGRAEVLRPTFSTLFAILGGAALAVVLGVIGFAGMVIFLVMAWLRLIEWRIHVGIPHGGVYAETFALWLVGYFGLTLLAGLALTEVPLLLRAGATMLASLIVLLWPILRGIPWRQVREDIGLVCERNPFVEIGAGVWCYIINLPLVGLGVAMTIILMKLQMSWPTMEGEGGVPESFYSTPEPAHPILQYLSDGDWTSRLQVFVLASVIAPIVEETFFRGVFHRHCRELTGRCHPVVSALASTTIVSFLFAAIHPQGLVVIPPLMFMAFGFSLMREWRGSLLPSMFAHGLSNGTVMTVVMIALSK